MNLIIFNLLINTKLPGIPSEGTPENETFWISFCSALYSGVLSSIVTGLIVGALVWNLQVQAENRADLNEVQKDLEKLCEDLVLIFSKNSINIITFPHEAIAPKLSEAIVLLKAHPLKKWQNLLGKWHYVLIEEMLSFVRDYDKFIVAADNFDMRLTQVIRNYNYKNNVAAVYDNFFYKYIIGIVIDATHDAILPHIHNASNEIIRKMDSNFANAILSEQSLIQPTELYKEARKNLWRGFQEVDHELFFDDLRNSHIRRTSKGSLLRSTKLRLIELCKKLLHK